MKKKKIILIGIFLFVATSAVLFLVWLMWHGREYNNGSDHVSDNLFQRIRTSLKTIHFNPTAKREGVTYYVNSDGDDAHDGLTRESPFKTIQIALEKALPGDDIVLADGTYHQDFQTVRNGEADFPITIRGTANAIVKGKKKSVRIAEIKHDYHTLIGFTIDGLDGDPSRRENYHDKLIYLIGQEKKDGVTGVRITKMNIKNAGGECVRLRYYARKNEVSDSAIEKCGAYDFLFDGGGKNGEGIYIGTAPEQTDDGKNPSDGRDHSDENVIRGNRIDTQGNECVDIKEGSSGNIVEENSCTGQKDPESAGLDARGSGNYFRKNDVFGNVGAGIRLGGDKKDDGIDNDVRQNNIHDNAGGGIKIQQNPQKAICANRFLNNKKGELVGRYADENENREKCSFGRLEDGDFDGKKEWA